jgi:hypothetical protein
VGRTEAETRRGGWGLVLEEMGERKDKRLVRFRLWRYLDCMKKYRM